MKKNLLFSVFLLSSFLPTQAMNPFRKEHDLSSINALVKQQFERLRVEGSRPVSATTTSSSSSSTLIASLIKGHKFYNCDPTEKNYTLLEPLLKLRNNTTLTFAQQQEIIEQVAKEYNDFNYFWGLNRENKETSLLLKHVSNYCIGNYALLQQIEKNLSEYNFLTLELQSINIEIVSQPGNSKEALPFHNLMIQKK